MKKLKLLLIAGLALVLAYHPMGCNQNSERVSSQSAELSSSTPEKRQETASTIEADAESPSQEPETTTLSSNSEPSKPCSDAEDNANIIEETTEPSEEREETDAASTIEASSSASGCDAETKTAVSSSVPRSSENAAPSTSLPSNTAPQSSASKAQGSSSAAQCLEHDFEYSEPVPPTCVFEGVSEAFSV